MKKQMMLMALVAMLSACTQQPAPSTELSTQAVSGWVSLANPVYTAVNPNNSSFGSHKDIEVVVNDTVPMIAYFESRPLTIVDETFSQADLSVSRWDDSTKTWLKLGSSVESSDFDVTNFSLAAKDRSVVVAYDLCAEVPDDYCGLDSFTTYVKRWTGSSWQQLGNSFCPQSLGCKPQLALGPSGQPFLLINDDSTGVYVYTWNAVTSSWVQLGGKVNSYAYMPYNHGNLQFTVDDQARPIVALVESESYATTGYLRVKRWNGSAWQGLGVLPVATTPDTNNFRGYSLTLSAGTTPVVAYSLKVNGSQQLFASYLSTCSNPWIINFPCWKTLGNQATLGTGEWPSLVSYEQTLPSPKTVYALSYTNANNLYVKSLGAASDWSLVGMNPLDVTLASHIEAHDLAFDAAKPLAVWIESNDPTLLKVHTTYAKRYQ